VTRESDADGNLGMPLLFLVDTDAPGLEKQHIPTALRAPDRQWTLFFDDVHVTPDRLVGSETGGLKAVFDGLNPERIMGAAIACGAGHRALDMASAYARQGVVWQTPIGAHQGISHPLAQAKIELELARLMTQKAAALYDAGCRREKRATWRSMPPAKRGSDVSIRPSRPTAEMDSRSSTASPTCAGEYGSCAPRRSRAR
jgi:alkylation response protein AidB-like acyl-CoA dehydrogenase